MKSFLIGAALAAASTFGQVTPMGGGYDFKMRFTPGQTMRYQISTDVQMAGQPMKTVQTLNQKVLAVKNGVATIEVSTTMTPTSTGGAPQTIPATKKTLRMDAKGKVVGGDAGMSSPTASLPLKPVRVGESWSSQVPVPGMPGGMANVTSTFRGLKSVNGQQVAEVAFRMNMSGRYSMNGTGTSLILVKDGQTLSNTMNAAMTMPNPQGGAGAKPMKINIAFMMKRV